MKGIALSIFIFWSHLLFGQSYFYNTQQFGLRSTLLGGSVTAGSEDLSMIYYNPAALKYARNKGFDFALFMPNYKYTSFGDLLGSGRDFDDRKLALLPSLVTYKTSINDNINIVFSYLQKDQWDNDYRHSFSVDDGQRIVKNAFSYDHQGDEKWFGVGSSIDLSDHVSVGISQFWSILGISYEYGLSLENQDLSDNQLDRFYSDQFDLNLSSTFSMVTKLGVAYDGGSSRIGLVVTSPNYGTVERGGSIEKATSIRDLGRQVVTNVIDFDLDPTFRYPWQAELGYSHLLPDGSQIWAKASYHTKVDPYDVFSIDRTNLDGLIFKNGYKEVTNFALGYAKDISDNLGILGSVRTNFSGAYQMTNNQREQSIIILDQGKLHLALGTQIAYKKSSFVVGLDYGFNIENEKQTFSSFPNIDLLSLNEPDFKQRIWTLIITYEFFLDTMGRNISRIMNR